MLGSKLHGPIGGSSIPKVVSLRRELMPLEGEDVASLFHCHGEIAGLLQLHGRSGGLTR